MNHAVQVIVVHSIYPGMCPGLNLQNVWSFNFYAQIISREFLVDTTFVHMYVLHNAAGN